MPIYFNNAATSHPKPESVIKVAQNYLNLSPVEDYRGNYSDVKIDVMTTARQALASLLGIKKFEQIIITQNATESLNLILMGLARSFKKKNRRALKVLTTNTEHNSVYRPLTYLQDNKFLNYKIIECDSDGNLSIEKIKNALTQNFDLFIVNHCSNVTGKFADLKKIGALCKENKTLFLVDSSQSAGIKKIDVNKFNIDFLAGTGHKNLFGFPGSGFLYIKNNIDIEPLKVGGTGILSQFIRQPEEPFYLKYECGTPNHLAVHTLLEGIKFIDEKGMQTIFNKKKSFAQYFVNNIKKNNNIKIYGGEDYSEREAIVSFIVRAWKCCDVAYILGKAYKIICRHGLHCAPLIHQSLGTNLTGTIRVSFSIFNDFNEIDILIEAINKLSK